MAVLTLSAADAALKEDYLPPMREELNNAFMLLSQIEKNTKDIEGRRAVLSLHVRRNSGVGARAEGGTLPTAGNQGYTEERVGLRYNYARIQLSGPVIRAMKSDSGSFVRAIKSETKGAVTDLKRDVNRQLFGSSDGVIAVCGTTTASTTVQLASTTSEQIMGQLEEGMVIDIGVGSPFTSIATGRTITAVDETAKTITISGAAVTTASTASVVRSGSGGSGASQVELTGLQTIVAASGSLFNVDPSTYSVWKSLVLDNSGTPRSATETLFAQAIQKAAKKGGVEVDAFVTTDGVTRNYASGLTSIKRFNDSLDLKGGWKGLSITAGTSTKALTWDRDAVSGQAFGLSWDHLAEHVMSDWEWMDEDGAVLSRVSGQDAYEATLFKYHELTTDQRNAHCLVKDLSES